MKHILALDQGTTSSRAIIFDHAGSIVSVAQQEFRQIFPKPGWVEHDANEIWATQSNVAAEAILKARLTANDVAAIGITNQRETTVVWERDTGKPIANAIVWQDRRTADACAALKGHEAAVTAKTGLLLDPYFSARGLRTGPRSATNTDTRPTASTRKKARAFQPLRRVPASLKNTTRMTTPESRATVKPRVG